MLKPLMQFVLDQELKEHPGKNKEKEEKAASLAQELLEKLWLPDEKPTTFWEKVKFVLSDGVNLPEKLFRTVVSFRAHQGLSDKKEEMQRVMFYTTKAFREGTEMLAAGCYLFCYNPLAFERYATSSLDVEEDIRQSRYDEENLFMPELKVGSAVIDKQSEKKENLPQKKDRRLPLLSFAPIKYGQHPCMMDSKCEVARYKDLFSEFSLQGFRTDPYKYTPLKKLLYVDQPESHYPSLQHKTIALVLNAYNQLLEKEPVCVCTHKGAVVSENNQKTI